MKFMAVRDFLVALGLVFVIEGLLFAAFPGALRKAMKSVLATPESMLRVLGLVAAVIGLAVIWLLRWTA